MARKKKNEIDAAQQDEKGLKITVSAKKDKGLYGDSDRIKITVTLLQDGVEISSDSDWVSL